MPGWTLVVGEIGRIALALALIVGSASAHADSPRAEFYRGIDVNEPPVEIDANRSERADSNQASSRNSAFDGEIAPILAKHCLECHGRSFQKGKLALSTEKSARAGG